MNKPMGTKSKRNNMKSIRWFTRKKPGPNAAGLKALGLACALCSVFLFGLAYGQGPGAEGRSVLSPGPIAGKTVYLKKARGYAFCEFEVVMGTPPNLVVQSITRAA